MLLKIAKRELQKWLFNRKEALFTPCHRSFARCVACMRQLLLPVAAISAPMRWKVEANSSG